MIHTAVVILNWNGRKHLEQFLPSVVEHTPQSVDIVVADNDFVSMFQSGYYQRETEL